MIHTPGSFSKKDLVFVLAFGSLLGVYAIHLLSFTLFDGFTTLSNDAGGYVLLARKWSPFFVPELAEVLTWPTHVYPPAFPWALALFGASETLYASHLFVSISLLPSIFLLGWIAWRQFGWLSGGMLAMTLCWLPGAVFSSMGILSENLYLLLSLLVLLLFTRMSTNENIGPGHYLLLTVLLSLSVLTRSIGIALIGAVFVVAVFDGNVSLRQKIRVALSVLASIVLWQLWGFFNPQPTEAGYLDYFAMTLASAGTGPSDMLSGIYQLVTANLVQMIGSWNHYLSLSDPNVYFFVFSILLLLICTVALGLRLVQRAPDAVYITFYLAILAVWPYPEEMTRFLHPVVCLIILQPVLYFMKIAETGYGTLIKFLVVSFMLVLLVNSMIIQKYLLDLRREAVASQPSLTHSFEYYASPVRENGELMAIAYSNVMQLMSESAAYLPAGSMVASVKHEFYTVLTGLPSINFVGIVPMEQQLCNLKIRNVDAVFFSNATTTFNPHGVGLLNEYPEISAETVSLGGEGGRDFVHLLKIDKARLDSVLDEAGAVCLEYTPF